jgi:hypothetical protein
MVVLLRPAAAQRFHLRVIYALWRRHMQRVGSVERATRRRVFDTGNFRGYTDYMIETEAGPCPAPQAFLVHQQPDWTLPVHYHLQDQFQVIVRGGGTLGRHKLASVSIHYASREAGYGPLVAGPDGLDYLTLRSMTDPGAWYLPEARANMRQGLRKRQETVGPISRALPAELAMRRSASVEVLIEPDASGLAAWVIRLGPEQSMPAPQHRGGGGRFHVVINGILRYGEDLVAPACVYSSSDDEPLVLASGTAGLEILVLQYPGAALDITAVTDTAA